MTAASLECLRVVGTDRPVPVVCLSHQLRFLSVWRKHKTRVWRTIHSTPPLSAGPVPFSACLEAEVAISSQTVSQSSLADACKPRIVFFASAQPLVGGRGALVEAAKYLHRLASMGGRRRHFLQLLNWRRSSCDQQEEVDDTIPLAVCVPLTAEALQQLPAKRLATEELLERTAAWLKQQGSNGAGMERTSSWEACNPVGDRRKAGHLDSLVETVVQQPRHDAQAQHRKPSPWPTMGSSTMPEARSDDIERPRDEEPAVAAAAATASPVGPPPKRSISLPFSVSSDGGREHAKVPLHAFSPAFSISSVDDDVGGPTTAARVKMRALPGADPRSEVSTGGEAVGAASQSSLAHSVAHSTDGGRSSAAGDLNAPTDSSRELTPAHRPSLRHRRSQGQGSRPISRSASPSQAAANRGGPSRRPARRSSSPRPASERESRTSKRDRQPRLSTATDATPRRRYDHIPAQASSHRTESRFVACSSSAEASPCPRCDHGRDEDHSFQHRRPLASKRTSNSSTATGGLHGGARARAGGRASLEDRAQDGSRDPSTEKPERLQRRHSRTLGVQRLEA